MLIDASTISVGGTLLAAPFADDTAGSIIRREGFPPSLTQHPHVPNNYECACCSKISPRRERGVIPLHSELAEQEYRRRMQWDVIEERARPSGPGGWNRVAGVSGVGSHTLRRFYATLQRPFKYTTRSLANPPPPRSLSELRRGGSRNDGDLERLASRGSFDLAFIPSTRDGSPSRWVGAIDAEGPNNGSDAADVPYLLLTVHQGRGFRFTSSSASPTEAPASSGFQIQARYGSVEGWTKVGHVASYEEVDAYHHRDSPASPVPRNSGMGLVQWDESFALPLQDLDTPVEIFVFRSPVSATTDQKPTSDEALGGLMIAPPVREGSEMDSWARFRGDHEDLVVTPFPSMALAALSPTKEEAALMQEPLISVTVSWEVCYFRQRNHATSEVPTNVAIPVSSLPARTSATRVTFDIVRVDMYVAACAGMTIPAVVHLMAQRPDGQCSEFVSLHPSFHAPNGSSLPKSLRRFDVSKDTGRTCSVECSPAHASNTMASVNSNNNNTVHLLVCCRDTDDAERLERDDSSIEAGDPLRVLAATLLTFSELPSKGTATYVLERSSDAGSGPAPTATPFGEITVHWSVVSLDDADDEGSPCDDADDEVALQPSNRSEPSEPSRGMDPAKPLFADMSSTTLGSHPSIAPEGAKPTTTITAPVPSDHDLLSLTIVRGIDLRRPSTATTWQTQPLHLPRVIAAVEQLTASTAVSIPRQDLMVPVVSSSSSRGSGSGALSCHVTWNQELRFHLPPHLGFVGERVELLVAEGGDAADASADIASIGALAIADRVAPLVTGASGLQRVAEGFDVVPLTQAGFRGTLGHILVRWRFTRHDVNAARQQRWRALGTPGGMDAAVVEPFQHPADAVLESTGSSTVIPSTNESPHSSPHKSSVSHVPFGKLNSVRSPPSVAAASTDADHSPFGKATSFVNSPAPPAVVATASPMKTRSDGDHASKALFDFVGDENALLQTQEVPDDVARNMVPPEGDEAVVAAESEAEVQTPAEVDDDHDDDDDDGIAFEVEAEDIAASSSGSCAPWETNTPVDLVEDDAQAGVEDHGSIPKGSRALPLEDELACDDQGDSRWYPAGGVANQLPEVPSTFAFRVRKSDNGKLQVAFFDPAAAAPVDAVAPIVPPSPEADKPCAPTVPPVNGPHVITTVSEAYERQWSSQLFPPVSNEAAERHVSVNHSENAARRLVEEELEVQFRRGNRSSAPLPKPFLPQPWYPPGESQDETHVPISRRESERRQRDAIVELRLKSRHVKAESVVAAARSSVRRMSRDVSRSTSVQLSHPPVSISAPPKTTA